jgi:hypothetical protein
MRTVFIPEAAVRTHVLSAPVYSIGGAIVSRTFSPAKLRNSRKSRVKMVWEFVGVPTRFLLS